jgi:hypothetical protein
MDGGSAATLFCSAPYSLTHLLTRSFVCYACAHAMCTHRPSRVRSCGRFAFLLADHLQVVWGHLLLWSDVRRVPPLFPVLWTVPMLPYRLQRRALCQPISTGANTRNAQSTVRRGHRGHGRDRYGCCGCRRSGALGTAHCAGARGAAQTLRTGNDTRTRLINCKPIISRPPCPLSPFPPSRLSDPLLPVYWPIHLTTCIAIGTSLCRCCVCVSVCVR